MVVITKQKQRQKRKRTLHEKHKERRKKDCMLTMPFILAFMGDPTREFYCADFPETYEIIPKTDIYNRKSHPWMGNEKQGDFFRLGRYMDHKVDSILGKILIYDAGETIHADN